MKLRRSLFSLQLDFQLGFNGRFLAHDFFFLSRLLLRSFCIIIFHVTRRGVSKHASRNWREKNRFPKISRKSIYRSSEKGKNRQPPSASSALVHSSFASSARSLAASSENLFASHGYYALPARRSLIYSPGYTCIILHTLAPVWSWELDWFSIPPRYPTTRAKGCVCVRGGDLIDAPSRFLNGERARGGD